MFVYCMSNKSTLSTATATIDDNLDEHCDYIVNLSEEAPILLYLLR